jgi:hypothetical protein
LEAAHTNGKGRRPPSSIWLIKLKSSRPTGHFEAALLVGLALLEDTPAPSMVRTLKPGFLGCQQVFSGVLGFMIGAHARTRQGIICDWRELFGAA